MGIISAYSYRDDKTVPAFPDDRPLIVFDGICALCSGFVRFVLRHDKTRQYRFLAAQSDLATALYRHYGLAADHWETNLLIKEGRLYIRSEAAIEIVRHFGGPWRAIGFLRLIPRTLRDWVYDRIAGNRYLWFGQHDLCLVPEPSQADRFLA
ncbi:thiol-disulfide oxidoreductase DCC family protein [Dongia mobilis]|jgi:predicted DCC family thiol-disulfide oxidoreductase YuxK|uniref:thiol-disulfide oxidoreductase DCC family protein n=1 Tax=Dongia sp. TaxID=1977262 RepID=UPI0026EDAEB8